MAGGKIDIAARLSVDPGNSKTTIKDIREEIKGAKKDMENAAIGSQEFQAAQERLAQATQQLSGVHKEQNAALGILNTQLRNSVPGFGGAIEGAQGLGTAFKALLANPIVLLISAIVVALTTLYKAFASTNDGADKLDEIFSGIGAVVEVVRDRILKFAGAIVKVLKLDFTGAINDAKAAVSGFGDEVTNEFRKAAEASRMLAEVEDATRELSVTRAKLNRDLAQAKEIMTDENATLAEKRKAIEQVREVEGKQTEQELANARKKYEAIKQRNSLTPNTSDENLDKEAEALAAVYELEQKSAQDRRTLNKQARAIDKQEKAKADEEEKARKERQKEADQKAKDEERQRAENHKAYMEKVVKLQHENELATIKDATLKKIRENEFQHQAERDAIEADYQAKKITADQREELLLETQRFYAGKLLEIKDEARRQELDAAKKHADELLRQEQQAAEARAKAQEESTQRVIGAINQVPKEEARSFEERRQLLDMSEQTIMAQEQWTDQQRTALASAYAQARMQIDQAEADHKVKMTEVTSQTLGVLSDVIGKETAAGKGLAVASATIDTYKAASKALASGSPPWNFIQMGAVILAGFKNVKAILSTQVPGKGSGGSSPSMPAAPVLPQAVNTTTQLDQQSINAIGNAASRSFVLTEDIQNNQEKIERLNRAARLG